MKFIKFTGSLSLAVIVLFFTLDISAQEIAPSPIPLREQVTKLETEKEKTETTIQPTENTTKVKPPPAADKPKIESTTAPAEIQALTEKQDDPKQPRKELLSEEEAAIIPYYNNYLKEYHLGPEDVISVEVFGQPNYSKAGINIPPTATIGYPLIPGGVFVGGKTLGQVEKEIAKKLDEYIIDPQVTVTLEKVGSARYSVLGDVGQPGVRLMTRRLSVSEALSEAGGVLPTGSTSKVVILRQGAGGVTQIPVNIKEINAGKAENVYLAVGDQVIVPGNKIKTVNKVVDIISKVSAFRLLFGSPF